MTLHIFELFLLVSSSQKTEWSGLLSEMVFTLFDQRLTQGGLSLVNQSSVGNPGPSSFTNNSTFWDLSLPSKIQIFLWLFCLKCLPCKALLHERLPHINPEYSFCGERETKVLNYFTWLVSFFSTSRRIGMITLSTIKGNHQMQW